jgi:Domain of unknown function (DUF4290)
MSEEKNLDNFIKDGMEYNTDRRGITLSQYGRNIQKLVTFALEIEDKDTRNRAAAQIIQAMEILNPKIRHIDNSKKILWNHLAIMSGHKLDIDYPFEIITKEEINSKPEAVPLTKKRIFKRQYGRIIENMIIKAIEVEDEELKIDFCKVILIQMKRIYVNWTKDVVSDDVIFEDFKKISNNQLTIPEKFRLPQSYEIHNRLRTNHSNPRTPTNNNQKKYRKRN